MREEPGRGSELGPGGGSGGGPVRDRERDGAGAGALAEALKYTQITGLLVAPMIVFGGIGHLLDRRLGTRPWLLLTGLILGMIGGFVNFFRLVLPPKGGGDGGSR